MTATVTAAVFLDRDGVLNEAVIRDGMPFAPLSVEDVVIPHGAAEALDRLRAAGFRLIMVTNQPDIVRGKVLRSTVDAINNYIRSRLRVDAVEMCTHDDADNCPCRKPKPGMLIHAAERDGISLADSFLIGDRWRDIEAGRQAGCRTILIGDGYVEGIKSPPDIAVSNLAEAADWIFKQTSKAGSDI